MTVPCTCKFAASRKVLVWVPRPCQLANDGGTKKIAIRSVLITDAFETVLPTFLSFLVDGITMHFGKAAALAAWWRWPRAGGGRCCSIFILLVVVTAMIEMTLLVLLESI